MLDPLSMTILRISAGYYIDESKFEAAVTEFRKMEEIDPGNLETNWLYLKKFLSEKEMDQKLLKYFSQIFFLIPRPLSTLNNWIQFSKTSGLQGVLKSMIDLFLKDPNPFILGTYYALTDQKDEALDWLEKAFESRSSRF